MIHSYNTDARFVSDWLNWTKENGSHLSKRLAPKVVIRYRREGTVCGKVLVPFYKG